MAPLLYRLVGESLEPLELHHVVHVAGRYSVSVAGLLSRLGEGMLSVADAAASGLLLPEPNPAPAPWGAVPTLGQDAQGRACVVLVPRPAPPPPEPPPAPEPPPQLTLPVAVEALEAAYAARLAQGWWYEHDLGQGAQWYLYAGLPADTRALLAGAVLVAQRRVAAGAADAFQYRCIAAAEVAAGWPPVLRTHTLAQLQAVMDAGATLLGIAGQIYDVARAQMDAALDQIELESALGNAEVTLAGACLPPVSEP